VRLDPGQGALWGAVIFAAVGVALAVEAAWSAGRWWGAVIVCASVLVLFAVRGDVVVDVVWNPWFGVIWLYTTMSTSWAVATGRLRWWPVAVVSASIVAQSHEVFARSRHDRVGFGWLAAGAAAGVVSWIAPVVQQLTTNPGNFTVLWRVAHQGRARVGLSEALAALGGASRLVPKWIHAPPLHGSYASFEYIANAFTGSQWWAVTAVVLLTAITLVALVTGRQLLAGYAALSLVAALGTVRAIATVPAGQFLNFAYLDVLLIPVGTAVWLSLAWAIVEFAHPVLGPVLIQRMSGLGRRARAATAHLATMGGVTTVAVCFGWSISSGVTLLGTNSSTIGGWAAVRATEAGESAVARVAPRTPFRLQLAEPSNNYRFAVLTGVAYLLYTEGFQPRLSGIAAITFGEGRANMPVVILHVPDTGDQLSTTVGPPGGSRSSDFR
jgi:hypothetical protein